MLPVYDRQKSTAIRNNHNLRLDRKLFVCHLLGLVKWLTPIHPYLFWLYTAITCEAQDPLLAQCNDSKNYCRLHASMSASGQSVGGGTGWQLVKFAV